MRSKLLSLFLGSALLSAVIAPVSACPYHQTNAAADQAQQTAQAQSQSDRPTE